MLLLLSGVLIAPSFTACGPATAVITLEHLAESESELEAMLPHLGPGDSVRLGQVGIELPDPGEGVVAEVILEDGSTQVLHIGVDADGRAALRRTPEALGESGTLTQDLTSPGACSDGAYKLAGHKWLTTFRWFFNPPPWDEARKAFFESNIREAVRNITGSKNNCGLTDAVSARQEYRGRTSTWVNITAGLMCSRRDGKSVVAVGSIDGALAATCTWETNAGTQTIESDVIIDGDRYWAESAKSPLCTEYGAEVASQAWVLEAVMTHEFGHTFGLTHVAENGHKKLTMSTFVSPCDGSASSLGLGDVRGLRRLY